MITEEQIKLLSKKKKINESVIFREYIQLLFLQELYSHNKNFFFKGGTALHLIWHSPCFSENLDFIVEMKNEEFLKFIKKIFNELPKKEAIKFNVSSFLSVNQREKLESLTMYRINWKGN
ncbi:hypothetical protein DRN73_06495 [Candidatus Pacearchaeota archaeon]|nr:MAG: hypothetical protein DRN73_06495 [Candidatus Pacearchaeota archaeon]